MEDEITQVDLRPGLTMIKRRTWKDDGRYLIYYEFERDASAQGPSPQTINDQASVRS
jgi:hypothetical protein